MRRNGFSLVELMVGILLISASLILVIGLYSRLIKSSHHSADLTVGTSVSLQIMEDFIKETQLSGRIPSDGASFGNFRINDSEYFYIMDVSSPKSSLEKANLKKIDVTVFWWNSLYGVDEAEAETSYRPFKRTHLGASGLSQAALANYEYAGKYASVSRLILYDDADD